LKVYFQCSGQVFFASTIAKRLPKLPSAKQCPVVKPSDIPTELRATFDHFGFRRPYTRQHPDGRYFGYAEFTPANDYARDGNVLLFNTGLTLPREDGK
jgi:hypothetical protein